MRSLAATLITAKNKLQDTYPWLILFSFTKVGWARLYYEALTSPFHEGAIVSGGGASGTILFVEETGEFVGHLIIEPIGTHDFAPDDTITDDNGTPGSATVVAPCPDSSDPSMTARFVRNTWHISFEDELWVPFPFTIDSIKDTKEELAPISVGLSNVNSWAEAYVRKGGGFLNCDARIAIVYAGDLTAPAAIDVTLTIQKCDISEEYINFTLGMRNPFLEQFPRFLYNRKKCRWKLNLVDDCDAGHGADCSKKLVTCAGKSNQLRFGGFPAIPGGYFE